MDTLRRSLGPRMAQQERAHVDIERAALGQIRVYRIKHAMHYKCRSASLPNTWYDQVHERDRWSCTCKGYRYTSHCKHLGAVQRRAEREGWNYHNYVDEHFPDLEWEDFTEW